MKMAAQHKHHMTADDAGAFLFNTDFYVFETCQVLPIIAHSVYTQTPFYITLYLVRVVFACLDLMWFLFWFFIGL